MQANERQQRNTRRAVPILGAVLVLVLTGMIIALCRPRTPAFVPPPWESAAVQGMPTVEKESLGYSELYRDGMAYRVALCGAPTVEQQALTVYFTNVAENTCYLKLRVLDANGTILGETGLLRPGEYVGSVALTTEIASGTAVRLKVMGYEPDTYASVGAVTLNVTVGGANA